MGRATGSHSVIVNQTAGTVTPSGGPGGVDQRPWPHRPVGSAPVRLSHDVHRECTQRGFVTPYARVSTPDTPVTDR